MLIWLYKLQLKVRNESDNFKHLPNYLSVLSSSSLNFKSLISIDMASSSSSTSTAMASSSADGACRFDVFISFCGEDTRHKFTDHLYKNLIHAGISTFRDNEGIKKGEELQSEFRKAIKQSSASIVVLSENYATSSWCLDELVLILEQRREYGHFVLPVFYHVEPTDIRKKREKFDIKVKPSPKWTDDNVNKWETALMEVADLAGHVVSGSETSILKDIIDTVYSKLERKEVSLPYNIIGLASHEEEINSWLKQCNLEFLVIHGMAGSGKTTLAKSIHNLNWKKFEFVSFLEGISEDKTTLARLQEQLLRDISWGKKRKIPNICRGMPVIENLLETNRALIVLDDVTDGKQLVDLLGNGKINSESKIIVTTREKAYNWFDLSCWRSQKYEMKPLNDDESLELLCHHACISKDQIADHAEIVKRALQYCEGNPMALKVFGSSLKDCHSVEDWESQMTLFERDMDSRLQEVLIRSYKSLPFDTVKELFLHIACFFNGIDVDYVGKILEPDYSAISGIKILIHKGLLSVFPNKKLMIHRLFQEMAKHIVRQESTKFPVKRSRVWLSKDSHMILESGKGSKTVEGLALDMQTLLLEDDFAFESSGLNTDAFKKMRILQLLQLNFAELSGSYKHVSKKLRWLCWHGFSLGTVPSDLYMGNLVAIDMSNSDLEIFEPPKDIRCLRILNLKDSHKLREIRNIIRIRKLETLILWNCFSLVYVCKTIGDLTNLSLLNIAGCKNLFNREQRDLSSAIEQNAFSFPVSLHRLFLKDCHLKCTDILPLGFSDQPFLQYLNLGSSLFESLPCYDHLQNLRVLDLSFCSRLKNLIGLPNTLAELYIYGCELLEKITFQSHRFTLQEFGYKGCINLYEVEDFFKLVPVDKLDETDLGHMTWLKEYQNQEVCLVGDDELTAGRSRHIQILYEFGVTSTSLPDLKDPNITPEYISESNYLSFDVPWLPKITSLKGINVSCKYSMFGDDWAWFCKISTTNGVVDWMYNPKVFGKPEVGEVCIWLSYWPIGNKLDIGDTVNVSIVVSSGVEVHECGVSLVYSNQEILENNKDWTEILGGDLSGFELSTRGYYLCRRDYYDLLEVGRLTSDWFRKLVGNTVDYTEIRGWRKTGRPRQVNDPSFTELKTIRCIIHGPQLEDIYTIDDMSESSFPDKTLAFTSSLLEGEITNEDMEYKSDDETVGDISTFDDITLKESDSNSPGRIINYAIGEEKPPSSSTSADRCRLFSLAEIQIATKNFSSELVIGRGGFGRVYKGQIFSEEAGHLVAIKRSDPMSSQGVVEFWAEIDLLSKLRHYNLVSLIGYCHENNERILVYEFMPKGSLYQQLHKDNTLLSWLTRLKIAIGAARGLDYLDTGLGPNHVVIHRDVKSSHILLNESWEAMISDFGLSEIHPTNQSDSYLTTTVKGTLGYMDPDYFYSGRSTRKSDVYAFGVVLFELLSGRLAYDRYKEDDQILLATWAQKCVKEGKLNDLVDPNIKGTISTKCLRQFAAMATRCVHDAPKERPTMSELVVSLQALLDLQEKSDRSAESSGIMSFPRKIYKYFVPAAKPNSGQSGKSSQKNIDDNKKQHNEYFVPTTKPNSDQSGTSSQNNLEDNVVSIR